MFLRNDRVSEQQIFVSKASHEMVIDHSCRLHECVADCRADESKTAFGEIFTHCVGFRSARGHILPAPPARLQRNAAGEIPYIAIEAAELFLHGEKSLCIADRRANLQPIPNDA